MISVSIERQEEISLDFRDKPGTVTRAMVRALNRAIASARTFMVSAVAKDTKLKSKDVRDAMVIREATMGRPEATLPVSLKRIPLIKFGARGPEPSRGRGRGVSYRLRGKDRNPNAFIATMKNGHRGVYERVGKKRLKIRELFGPSLGHVFAKFRPEGLAKAHEAFAKNFNHEMNFARTEDAGGTD